jgi:hypothetical protein
VVVVTILVVVILVLHDLYEEAGPLDLPTERV